MLTLFIYLDFNVAWCASNNNALVAYILTPVSSSEELDISVLYNLYWVSSNQNNNASPYYILQKVKPESMNNTMNIVFAFRFGLAVYAGVIALIKIPIYLFSLVCLNFFTI